MTSTECIKHTDNRAYRQALLDKLPWAERPAWRGIDCGDGWLHLVDAFADLAIARDWRVLQVKEKFGTLRLYFETRGGANYRREQAIVSALEHASSTTCEACGECGWEYDWETCETVPRAYPTSEGWIKTLCKACHAARDDQS